MFRRGLLTLASDVFGRPSGYNERQQDFLEQLKAEEAVGQTYLATFESVCFTLGRTMPGHADAEKNEIFILNRQGDGDMKKAITALASTAAHYKLDLLLCIKRKDDPIHDWMFEQDISPWIAPGFATSFYTLPAGHFTSRQQGTHHRPKEPLVPMSVR
jgi:hypothetical protein